MIMIEGADKTGIIENIVRSIMSDEMYKTIIKVDGNTWYVTNSNAFCIPTLENCHPAKVIGMLANAENIELVESVSIKSLEDARAELVAAICTGTINSIEYTIKDRYDNETRYCFNNLDGKYWEDLSDDVEPMTTVDTSTVVETIYALPIAVCINAKA